MDTSWFLGPGVGQAPNTWILHYNQSQFFVRCRTVQSPHLKSLEDSCKKIVLEEKVQKQKNELKDDHIHLVQWEALFTNTEPVRALREDFEAGFDFLLVYVCQSSVKCRKLRTWREVQSELGLCTHKVEATVS